MLWWSPWWLALYAGVVAGAVARWWLPWSLAAAVGGAVTVGLVALWALWWRLPRWQTDRLDRLQIIEPKDRAGVEDNFRKTISQVIGGIAVLIGAAFAYYGTLQTLRSSDEQSRRSLQASRDLLISQQVSKGFEDLGSPGDNKLMLRVGGIYALEGVMNDPGGQYHQPVLEALCAFVRDDTKDYKGEGPPATDVQAALTVIGRRAAGKGRVDLTGARIPRVSLSRADLTDANLIRANLSLADLSGAKNVTQDQLDEACGSTGTKLPPKLTIKPCSTAH
jgi:hypothetical protein